MSIGQRLKAARLAQRITQEDLAKSVGVTKGAIGNYETDVSSPKDSILIKLMEVLQIDANYVYQDYIRPVALSEEERRLIDLYRGAEESAREIAVETLTNHQRKTPASSAG
jgi:transcriptional regulator with XRE-family HTH domain